MAEESQELCFITVIGKDQKGIIAKMSHSVYENGLNIEDISQKVIDGTFVMNMVVDVYDYEGDIGEIREELEEIGDEMGLKVQLQHEEIVKNMQRV